MMSARLQNLTKWLGAAVIALGLSIGGVVASGNQVTGVAVGVVAAANEEIRAELTPVEMVTEANKFLASMRSGFARVIKLQGVAKQQKDIIKLNCVNDKLLLLKGWLTLGEDARTDITEGITREDDDLRYSGFTNLTIASEKVALLVAEAETCVGEDLTYVGKSDIVVEGGEEPDDPTLPPDPVMPEVDLTPIASPFI